MITIYDIFINYKLFSAYLLSMIAYRLYENSMTLAYLLSRKWLIISVYAIN